MTEASPRPLTRGIIRAALDRVAPGRTLEEAAPVVACPAAERVRVLDANGAERACEYAPQADAPAAREALARELAAGILPSDRCRWCSELAQHGALARAPAVRRYAPSARLRFAAPIRRGQPRKKMRVMTTKMGTRMRPE